MYAPAASLTCHCQWTLHHGSCSSSMELMETLHSMFSRTARAVMSDIASDHQDAATHIFESTAVGNAARRLDLCLKGR